jgi:hypothetical protein
MGDKSPSLLTDEVVPPGNFPLNHSEEDTSLPIEKSSKAEGNHPQ